MPKMLPNPTLTFTIPSLHDELPLECRVHLPKQLTAAKRQTESSSSCDGGLKTRGHVSVEAPAPSTAQPTPLTNGATTSFSKYRKRAAIIAHPYAPLGGSMDDYIVQSIGSVLLDLGFVVGLFNFRGAGSGKGHTSWTGRAETADYKSFVIWMVEFLERLEGWAGENGANEGDMSAARGGNGDVQGGTSQTTATKDTLLIIGGYSYGSLITTLLPPLPALITPPASTTQSSSSPFPEILLRAQHLASLQNEVLRTTRRPETHRRKDLEVRCGGDEDIRRVSREQKRSLDWSRRSVDRIRGNVDVVRSISARRRENRSEPIPEQRPAMDQEDDEQQVIAAAPSSEVDPDDIDTAYLLISPLRGTVKSLLQPSALLPSFLSPNRKSSAPITEVTDKFISHPTLAIYGDSDHFSSLSKQRSWVLEMEGAEGSKFHALEVEGTGHFWHGIGEVEGLKRVVKGWAEDLSADEAMEGS